MKKNIKIDFLGEDSKVNAEEVFEYEETMPLKEKVDEKADEIYFDEEAGENDIFKKIFNLFIPHEGNNHRPEILHPYRLLFHAVSAVAIKGVLMLFVLAYPVSAYLTPDLIREQSLKVIELTNELRSSLGIHALNENPDLAHAAYAKSQDMLVNQYFAHVGPDNRTVRNWLKDEGYQYSVAGENLAMGFADAKEVVDAWRASKTHYNNLVDKDYTEIGVGMASGDYKGNDTTFIAQMFGRPSKAKNYLSINTNLFKKEEDEKDLGEIEQVKSEKDLVQDYECGDDCLNPPSIVAFSEPFLTNNKRVIADLLSLGSERVVVYDNKEIAGQTFKRRNDEKAELDMYLEEGIHKIYFEAVLGERRASSSIYTFTIDKTAPLIDYDNTKVELLKLINEDKQAVKVSTILSSDANSAKLFFGKEAVDLFEVGEGYWKGSGIIEAKEENLIVLPSLVVTDFAGNISEERIEIKDLMPQKPSLLSQYFFLRTHPSDKLKPLFDISSVYYKFLLVLVLMSLLVNIFVKIRKQHSHVILSTLGFITVLILLIII